ncbi:MAG: Flp family type IVb pilin [Syntrophomonadaceae bacterium]|jgi:pilus assembly protein Flp/PilA|nr:Flp family type IVb pilin [Syntrophomonadaceae bacterium]
MDFLKRLMVEEDGQGMTEYGLILALVSVVVIGVLITMGTELRTIFTNVLNGLRGAAPPASPS